MKEASGEANMTVITIALIAIVLAVGTVIIRRVMTTTKFNSCCNSAGGEMWKGTCCWKVTSRDTNGKVSACGDYTRNVAGYGNNASITACMKD